MPPGLLQAKSLAALPGIRHAFFTREGGVSQGIYASLNGGVGSTDAREQRQSLVLRWRNDAEQDLLIQLLCQLRLWRDGL